MTEKKSDIHKEVKKIGMFFICFYFFNFLISLKGGNNFIVNNFKEIDIFKDTTILTKTYSIYILFLLKIGHLFLFAYLIKNLHKNSSKKYILRGVIYFSLGIFFETLITVIRFKDFKTIAYTLEIGVCVLGSLNFLNYFIKKIISKGKGESIELILISLIAIFFAFSNFDIKSFKVFLNVFLYSVILLFTFFNIFLSLYKRDFLEKKEAINFLVLLGIEGFIYRALYKIIQLNNFEIVSLMVFNFVMVDLKMEDYKGRKKLEHSININYTRTLLTFLLISIFFKSISISGVTTLFIIALIISELIFFSLIIEMDYDVKIFNLFLNKMKLIETRERAIIFLEEELTKYFRLVDIKVVLYSASKKNNEQRESYVSFESHYNTKRYDLEIDLIEISKEIGKIYIKDSHMVLNKNKLRKFMYLIEKITPILENLILKEIQVEYYRVNKKEVLAKMEELEKENYYLKEIIKLTNKKDVK